MSRIIYLAQLIDKSSLPNAAAGSGKLQTILNIAFGTIGALAFFMMVLGGFRYVISGGDPAKVTAAKGTIIYAAVGVVVAASAAIIVNFVMGKT